MEAQTGPGGSADPERSQPRMFGGHLESGSDVVIIEGTAEPVSGADLVEQVVSLYNSKYKWDVDPNNLPGPYYAVHPQVAFGWLS